MIEVENLVKWYGQTLAVDNLNFTIPRGQIVGFLGPNGAGKTTTLRMLTGYLPPTSGRVTLDGHDVLTDSLRARAKIGYLPESTPLYPEMRVEEYLHYRGKLHRMDRDTRRRRIDTVCDQCGLAQVRRRLIGQLSKGNKQRVGLAQAMLHEPPVLILDEPTAGLDPNQITHVRELIDQLRGEHTIILSTHILPEVERLADRLMVIAGGAIVAQGTPEELRSSVSAGSRILIEVNAQPQDVSKALGQVSGVKQVETATNDGWCRATVTPKDNADPREAIGQTALHHGWTVREMRYETASLEQFFVQVTAQQGRAATEDAA